VGDGVEGGMTVSWIDVLAMEIVFDLGYRADIAPSIAGLIRDYGPIKELSKATEELLRVEADIEADYRNNVRDDDLDHAALNVIDCAKALAECK
jgi:hypothetical protein